MPERSGFLVHVGVDESAVAVMRMSGWCINRGEVAKEVKVIEGTLGVDDVDGVALVASLKEPMMFTTSPVDNMSTQGWSRRKKAYHSARRRLSSHLVVQLRIAGH